MGAFDHLSDDDPRVIAYEEKKLKNKYSKSLSEYSLEELENEVKNRNEKIKQISELLKSVSTDDLKQELKQRDNK